ncbi:MAG: hypothetical protein MUC49_21275 [Raineya sp.]|jgi:hypothetical protein|nr:hypothetical protein [Raineya sp.]
MNPFMVHIYFPIIDGSIYTANPYLLQYENLIENKFFELGGGKKGFRELPKLMRASSFGTNEYKIVLSELQTDAINLKCKIEEIVYEWKEDIKW